VPEIPLIGHLPIGQVALEVSKVLPRGFHRLCIRVRDNIDYAVGRLHIDRAHLFRPETAESAALDHGGTGHPEGGCAGGDDHVRAAGEGSIARKAASGNDADQWYCTGERGHG